MATAETKINVAPAVPHWKVAETAKAESAPQAIAASPEPAPATATPLVASLGFLLGLKGLSTFLVLRKMI